jgi:riboflavin biosynthesis pyrimidine reductase
LSLLSLVPNRTTYGSLSEDEQSWAIASAFGICNGWRLNFVVDISLAKWGSAGDSSGVSSTLDRLLLGKLRSQADLIVTTGRTARVERYKSSKHAPIAILTRTGDLDLVPAVQGTQYFTPLILTSEADRHRVTEQLEDVDVRIMHYASNVDSTWPTSVATLLAHEGFQSPILEAGPETVHEFLSAGVLTEICVTVTKESNQAFSARMLSLETLEEQFGPVSGFQICNLFVSGNNLFARWQRA